MISGAEGLGSALFGQGVENPIFLDDTGCLGNETGLIFCPHSGAGQHNCFHFEDAGVRCQRRSYKTQQNIQLGP